MIPATKHLVTDRLLLRPWRPHEAERLFDIRRRKEVAMWLGDPTPWVDLLTAHDKIAAWHEQTLSPSPTGVWAVTQLDVDEDEDTTVGSVSLNQLPGSNEIEIGWYLHPDSAGRGFATEAALALLNTALSNGLERVWAIMWPNNEASARVAKSIGMTELGIINDPWYGTETDPTSRIFRAGSASPGEQTGASTGPADQE